MSYFSIRSDMKQKSMKPTFDFSIESLLRKESSESDIADESSTDVRNDSFMSFNDSMDKLSPLSAEENKNQSAYHWLNCTRFKPPKLPRSRKRVGCKRYGRGPRIPFAPHQIAVLENTFMSSQYLSSECIHHLAKSLNLTETRVKIWFQNRRARYRREREIDSNIIEVPNVNSTSRKSVSSPIDTTMTATNLTKAALTPMIPPRHITSSHNSTTQHSQRSHNASMNISTNNGIVSARKRKLLIPHFISLQLKNQLHSNQERMLLPPITTSATNSSNTISSQPLNVNSQQAMQFRSFPFPAYLSALNSGELSLSYTNANNASAHFGRILCGGSSSAFAPVQLPFQTTHN